MNIHVLVVPEKELRRESVGEKWCFKCRRRTPHDAVTYAPVDPHYYGPRWQYECSRCHEDHTSFPGLQREYRWKEDG